MKLKNDVGLTNVQPPIWYAVGVADQVYRSFGYELVVTSLNDGKHMDGSFHYKGLAVDLRIHNIKTATECQTIYAKLHNTLDFFGFDVILEADHIHVEYDPKAGDHDWHTRTE